MNDKYFISYYHKNYGEDNHSVHNIAVEMHPIEWLIGASKREKNAMLVILFYNKISDEIFDKWFDIDSNTKKQIEDQ